MCSQNKTSNDERLKCLKSAVKDHQDTVIAGMNGFGIEKHLTALKLIAKENGIPVPNLFYSEGFLKGCAYKMDGSQV